VDQIDGENDGHQGGLGTGHRHDGARKDVGTGRGTAGSRDSVGYSQRAAPAAHVGGQLSGLVWGESDPGVVGQG